MFKNSYTESASFFNKYMKEAMQNKRKANDSSYANIRCQRCLKFGHQTYECKNEVAYVYRPSRTMQFKDKNLRYELNSERPPDVPQVWDGDRKRSNKKVIDVDITSSSEEDKIAESLNLIKQQLFLQLFRIIRFLRLKGVGKDQGKVKRKGEGERERKGKRKAEDKYQKKEVIYNFHFFQKNTQTLKRNKRIMKKDYEDEYEYDNVCYCIPFKKRKANLRKSNLTNASHVLSLQDEKEKRSFYESPGLANLGTPDISQSKKKLQSSGYVFDQPKNKLFLMDGKQYGNNSQILIKITERELNTNVLTQSWQPNEHQDKTTPVYVARYIAKRLKQNHQVVVDLGCGMGGNTVQFAKECSYVIGVDIDLELLKITEESCQQNKVNYKVDLVNANLFDLKNLKADVIFTNPTCKTRGRNKNIDMDIDCQPNFLELIQKCKLMAPNTIIQMPANIDITQLTQYFNFNKFNSIIQKQYVHSAIEVEQLIVNNVHEWNIIYVGDVANVTNDEIYHILAKLLNKYQKQPNQKVNLKNLFKTLQRYISTYNLIIQVLDSTQEQHTIEKFLYELQLHYIKDMDLISAYSRIQQSKNQQDFEYVQSIVQQSFNNMHHDRDDMPHSPALYSIKEDNIVPQFSYTNSFDQFEQNNEFQLQYKSEKYS